MPRVLGVLLNPREEVEGFIADALEIVNALELDDELRVPAFNAAVSLLSAKFPIMQDDPPILPRMDIPGLRRQ